MSENDNGAKTDTYPLIITAEEARRLVQSGEEIVYRFRAAADAEIRNAAYGMRTSTYVKVEGLPSDLDKLNAVQCIRKYMETAGYTVTDPSYGLNYVKVNISWDLKDAYDNSK